MLLLLVLVLPKYAISMKGNEREVRGEEGSSKDQGRSETKEGNR